VNAVADNLLRVLEIALAGALFYVAAGYVRFGRRRTAQHGGAPVLLGMAAALSLLAVLTTADAVGAGVEALRFRDPAWQLFLNFLTLVGSQCWLKQRTEREGVSRRRWYE